MRQENPVRPAMCDSEFRADGMGERMIRPDKCIGECKPGKGGRIGHVGSRG